MYGEKWGVLCFKLVRVAVFSVKLQLERLTERDAGAKLQLK